MAIKLSIKDNIPPYTGINRQYILNKDQLNEFNSFLVNPTSVQSLDFLFKNPAELVTSVRVYPFPIKNYLSDFGYSLPYVPVMLGNARVKDSLGSGITAYCLPEKQYFKKIAEFVISPMFANSFLDYAPFTKLELYIPFCGYVPLDTGVVMNKKVAVYYSIDFNTGSVTAYIMRANTTETDVATNGDVIQTANGIIGFEYPYGASNSIENTRMLLGNTLSAAGGIISSIATSNPIPAALSILGATASLTKMSEHITKGGDIHGVNSLVASNKVALIRTSQSPVGSAWQEYAHFKGRPLMQRKRLGDMAGFTKCGSVHLEAISGATENEKRELEQLLLSGIIINPDE